MVRVGSRVDTAYGMGTVTRVGRGNIGVALDLYDGEYIFKDGEYEVIEY